MVISVRKDWPELVGILNKGLAAITPEEMAELCRRWFGADYFSIPYKQSVDYTRLWQVSAAALLILTVILYWNRKLTREIMRRHRVEVELGLLSRHLEQIMAERTRDLQDANAALHRFTREISHIEERERERRAGDLHDSPMQKLALAQAQIVSAARHRDKESDQQLEIGVELMREALQELRSLQFELSPPVLRQEGLASALR
jgi:signal transduction histidine kinase